MHTRPPPKADVSKYVQSSFLYCSTKKVRGNLLQPIALEKREKKVCGSVFQKQFLYIQ